MTERGITNTASSSSAASAEPRLRLTPSEVLMVDAARKTTTTRRPSWSSRIFSRLPMPRIAGFALALAGTFGVAHSLGPTAKSWASLRWPSVQGTVTSAGIIRHLDEEGTAPEVRVTYTYTIDGEALSSTRVRFSPFGLRSLVGIPPEYEEAEPVQVAYDPRDPSESVLQPGPTIGGHLSIAASLTAIGAGLTLLLQQRRSKTPKVVNDPPSRGAGAATS